MLVGTILICLVLLRLLVLMLLRGKIIQRFLKRQVCKLLLPFSVRKKAISAERKRVEEEILDVRVALSHRTLVLYVSLAVIFTSFSVVNIFTQSPRYLNRASTWLLEGLLGFFAVYAFLPRVLCRSTLNLWYALFTLMALLYFMPFCTPVPRSIDALLLCILVRLPSSIMATRTLWVVLSNLLLSMIIVLRCSVEMEIDDYFEGNTFFLSVVICIEVSSFLLAVAFAGAVSGWIGQRAEMGRENSRMSSDLSAVSMLLRLMSDAVVELDQDLRLLRHSPELSAMLMRDRPGSSLEGLAFTEFVHSSEATRAWELLKNPSCVLSAGQGTSAHAFHTRLVDTFANKVCVEVFHVQGAMAPSRTSAALAAGSATLAFLGAQAFTASPSVAAEGRQALRSRGQAGPQARSASSSIVSFESAAGVLVLGAAGASAASRAKVTRGAVLTKDDQGRFRFEAPEVPLVPSEQPGAVAPLGFFDPLGFSTSGLMTFPGDSTGFKHLRAAEIKHGRFAMMAATGSLFASFVKLPGFEDVPTGLAALNTTKGLEGFSLLFFLIAGHEAVTWKPVKEPGSFGDPFKWNQFTSEMRTKELNNGRIAMFAIIGQIAAELQTGKGPVEQFTGWIYFVMDVVNPEGEIRHLLGLRDFTDSSSLSGERATDAMDTSGPTSPVQSLGLYEVMSSPMRSQALSTSDEEWGTTPSQRQAFLEVDMEVKVVHSASASVSFLAGSSLTDFFAVPHTVQLLQNICDEAQRGLDQEGALPQKVFNYQDLPVRWGSGHYGSIHGTFQVVLCRFGRIGVAISFAEPSLTRHSGRRASKGSSRSSV
ncbi:FCPF, partial [Symbiodinium microadriaticum]